MKQLKFLILAASRRYLMLFGMSLCPLSIMRVGVLRVCGVRVGRGCYIGFNVICDSNFPELIHIGNDVTISHNCILMAHTGTPCNSLLGKLYQVRAKIEIGDGAWIGAGSLLLPGVTVASHCMVGAGSVVTKSTDKHALWAGNPCRRIKSLATDKSS
jgi:acetyltransferase-like isoleucine patch superfamily enzyme